MKVRCSVFIRCKVFEETKEETEGIEVFRINLDSEIGMLTPFLESEEGKCVREF